MDRLTPEQRRKNMQHIKSKDSKAELLLRSALWKLGYRYRKNYKSLPGSPDIVFLKEKIVIFIDGEFWHGYNWKNTRNKIGTNRKFWINKIEKNIQRDLQNNSDLESLGWKVLRFWSRDILKNIENCIREIEVNIKREN